MASGAGANTRTAAKGKPTAVVPTVRPRRRESPLAAAARRAKEAMERRPTRSKEVMQGVAQRSEVSEKAKVSPSRRPPGSQRNQSKESKEQSTDPKDAQDVKERLERSEGRSEKDRDFTRTVGKFEKHGFTVPSPETSAGSTPKCVLSEDTSTKIADRSEILEAAQVLRREAQDLGQALRQWVAEAEATKKEEVLEDEIGSEDPSKEQDLEVPFGVEDGTEARPNSPVLEEPLHAEEPVLEVKMASEVRFGRQHLEQECERLDADIQRVAGEWHRLLAERQKTIEALAGTEPSRLSAPVPLPMRATMGPTHQMVQAACPPCPARATVPLGLHHQAGLNGLARSPSPVVRRQLLETGHSAYLPASPVLSPLARGVSPVGGYRHTPSPVSPFAGSSPLMIHRRTLSPMPLSPVRSVSPYRLARSPIRPVSPQLPTRVSSPQLIQAPVGTRFLVPRGLLQVQSPKAAARPAFLRESADGQISHL